MLQRSVVEFPFVTVLTEVVKLPMSGFGFFGGGNGSVTGGGRNTELTASYPATTCSLRFARLGCTTPALGGRSRAFKASSSFSLVQLIGGLARNSAADLSASSSCFSLRSSPDSESLCSW